MNRILDGHSYRQVFEQNLEYVPQRVSAYAQAYNNIATQLALGEPGDIIDLAQIFVLLRQLMLPMINLEFIELALEDPDSPYNDEASVAALKRIHENFVMKKHIVRFIYYDILRNVRH
jgi:hypothetical protein